MNKDAKFQIRVSGIVLEKFDEIVGPKNRSKVLTDYMEYVIQKEFNKQTIEKRGELWHKN